MARVTDADTWTNKGYMITTLNPFGHFDKNIYTLYMLI